MRAALFHSTVFLTGGVVVSYFPVWMSQIGLTAQQIGIVNALPLLLVLLSSVYTGRLADRASDWRVVIIGLSIISGLASLGFAFVNGFWGILFAFALCYTPADALVPVLDAATMRMTQRRKTNFGAIRAWGTVGFIASATIGGLIIGWWGGIAFVPMLIAAALLRAAFSLQLPKFRADDHLEQLVTPKASGMKAFMKPWFILPCVAFALINATHFFLGFMGGLIWKMDGIPEGWFGPLAAYAAVGEAVAMFFWGRMNLKISARNLLIVAALVDAIRFFAMAFNPSLPALFGLQTLHAIAFPFSYFGLVQFVAESTPEDIAAEAQGFASMLTQGFAVATFLTFGAVVSVLGGYTFLVSSGMCVVAAGVTLLSLRMVPSLK